MARYVSQYAAYKIQLIPPVSKLVMGAEGPEIKLVGEGYVARFRQGALTDYEREQAIGHFRFKGVAEGEDPYRRLSVFDTDDAAVAQAWDEETKAAVEHKLDIWQGADYFRCDPPRKPIPWPSYEKAAVSKIPGIVAELGLDPQEVIAYERENQNRPEVIKSLGETAASEDEDVLVEA